MEVIYSLIIGEWERLELPEIKQREADLEGYLNMGIKKIVAVVGFRRSGKTFVILNLIKKLLKTYSRQEVVYINFEDERIPRETWVLSGLLAALKEKNGKKPKYLFLDEIQDMPEWSRWLRRIYDQEKEMYIFVSGSSSKLSSKEIPTELRGRCMEKMVYSLSWNEYVEYTGVNIQDESEKMFHLGKYLNYGGLPEVVEVEEYYKKELVKQYLQTVIKKDVIERNKFKNEIAVNGLIEMLLNTTIYSANKMYNTMKSKGFRVGKSVMNKYFAALENAFFVEGVRIFSYKIKDKLDYARKIYFSDNALIKFLSLGFFDNMGRLLENMVFLELRRREEEVGYWKNSQGEEVDFVVSEGVSGVKQLIQVCYKLTEENRKRELRSLVKAMKELRGGEPLIISWKDKEEIEFEGVLVRVVPVEEWLRGEK